MKPQPVDRDAWIVGRVPPHGRLRLKRLAEPVSLCVRPGTFVLSTAAPTLRIAWCASPERGRAKGVAVTFVPERGSL